MTKPQERARRTTKTEQKIEDIEKLIVRSFKFFYF